MITIPRIVVPVAAALTLGTLISIPAAAQNPDGDLFSVDQVRSEADARRVERIILADPTISSTHGNLFVQGAGPVDLGDPAERAAADRADDPAGLLNEQPIGAFKSLAARLSANRDWLTSEALQTLDVQNLRLEELFAGTPQLVRFDNRLYRIVIEKVGPLWTGFDPAVDPYVVFLNHEIYDGLGEDRAVAFENGDETVLFQWDFERIPALAVTLEGLSQDETAPTGARVQGIGAAVRLGKPRVQVERDFTAEWETLMQDFGSLSNIAGANSCAPEIAPTSCSGGKPVCGTAGYSPYFVMRSVKIKTDHEGCCFKGNPEIELFPMRLDATSPAGGTTNATTNLIFSGRTITDIAGRSRFLPDVNSNNVWYTVSNGLALFPTNSGMEWNGTLVEDDDATGVLKMNATRVNVTKLFRSLVSIVQDSRQLNFFFLLKAVNFLQDIIGLFNDGDDLYQESIGVANSLFCTNGLGQPFPKIFTLVSQEWEMQGYYACVNPSCLPPPPPPPQEEPCGSGTGVICP